MAADRRPHAGRAPSQVPHWWSTPFREWLPWALPFVGGIAFHEFPDVPAYPASHGCVRQAVAVARWTYDFASVGMPVAVLARSGRDGAASRNRESAR